MAMYYNVWSLPELKLLVLATCCSCVQHGNSWISLTSPKKSLVLNFMFLRLSQQTEWYSSSHLEQCMMLKMLQCLLSILACQKIMTYSQVVSKVEKASQYVLHIKTCGLRYYMELYSMWAVAHPVFVDVYASGWKIYQCVPTKRNGEMNKKVIKQFSEIKCCLQMMHAFLSQYWRAFTSHRSRPADE